MPTLDLTSALPELREVAAVADRQTRSLVDEDVRPDDLRTELVEAAGAAMAAGCSLAEIAQAEQYGKATARAELGADLLKRVARSARRLHEVEAEHTRSILQAVDLGLPYRDIGQAAGVSHGTIRAISGRGQPGEQAVTPSAEQPGLDGE